MMHQDALARQLSFSALAAACCLALAACAAPGQRLGAGAAIRVTPTVEAPPARRVQAIVNEHTASDVGRVELTLEDITATPALVASASVPAANLGWPITFAHLRTNRTYRIGAAAFAWDLTTDITGQATDVVVPVGDDENVPPVAIAIRLADKLFDGTATAGITIATGAYTPGSATTVGAGAFQSASTFAGSGIPGHATGPSALARFQLPEGLGFHGTDLIVADAESHCILRVDPTGSVSLEAGVPHPGAFTNTYLDGPVASAEFNLPSGIAVDGSGTIFVADAKNNAIRQIASGTVEIFAGDPAGAGFQDGTATGAHFSEPRQIAFGPDGNLYVADSAHHVIRMITPAGVVTTIAGQPTVSGFADNVATDSATFNFPSGIAVDASGTIYVADTDNHAIRKIAGGLVSTLAGAYPANAGYKDDTGGNAQFFSPRFLAVEGTHTLYVADRDNHRIRRVNLSNGMVDTLMGTHYAGFADGPARSARLHGPQGIIVAPGGVLYVTDGYNHRIRKIQ